MTPISFHPELECWIFFSSFAAALFLLGLICTGREGGCNGKVQYWRIWLKRLIRCKMISNLWRWWSPSNILSSCLSESREDITVSTGGSIVWLIWQGGGSSRIKTDRRCLIRTFSYSNDLAALVEGGGVMLGSSTHVQDKDILNIDSDMTHRVIQSTMTNDNAWGGLSRLWWIFHLCTREDHPPHSWQDGKINVICIHVLLHIIILFDL